MTATSYTSTIDLDATPEEVYRAVVDVRGWWNADIEGPTDTVGESFRFEVPGIHRSHILVTGLEPGRRATWRVLDNWMAFVADEREWIDTEIRFEIESAPEGRAVLRFTHDGLTPLEECYELCSNAWTHFVRSSLKQLVESGVGVPGSNPDEERVRADLARQESAG